MPGPCHLVDWPWVTVEVELECSMCRRAGRYRLARLAERYGAGIQLWALLTAVAGRCGLLRPEEKPHKHEARCGIRFRVPPDGPLPEAVPAREAVKGEVWPPQPGRLGPQGPQGPQPTVGQARRQGITHVNLHCYGLWGGHLCHHTADMPLDTLGLPEDLAFVGIGRVRRLVCRRCGGRDPSVMARWPDPREVHARGMSGGSSEMREVNGILIPLYPDPAQEPPAVPSMPNREIYSIVQDDDDTYAVVFARTDTVVHLNGVPQLGLGLDRADDVADHLEAIDRIATARKSERLDG